MRPGWGWGRTAGAAGWPAYKGRNLVDSGRAVADTPAVNEKLIETLFNHYALQFIKAGGVTIYTPTTRQEYIDGYDAKLVGAAGFDELRVQFKAPALLDDRGYSFGLTRHQHWRLRKYKPNSAFYVAHTFAGLPEIQEAQLTMKRPTEFLRR